MGGNEKVLIIDDEPAFVEACTRTLESKSYRVVTASSKALAQELMGLDPDLVILGTIAPAGQAFATHRWQARLA